ncbi:ABC-2 family transporter protein [Novipirellula galeiformis]|uniref:ABC-2 family transporter protein n=1 Tax=Novipirellula galeiformis TaxID=2528004 RepID=A0A5C6CDT6_9BACT|nr:ABC transporter permease [Novipirellula galeiformis]TWU21526.1 ABC-2 family transporter protein [Novipirellula galeiformis]
MNEMLSIDPASVTPATNANRWERFDAWCERKGDQLNPILVKETRQALKSRQFVVTFSVLLFASLGWTVAGSLSQMPQIYTTPSAARLMIGYYVVLAIPMLLVVPLAAYRSLEGEIDDGTLELLSITALSPWQIVLGKLASASLQMMMYFVALFPCMAYAYTLRGVDLPTTLIIIATLLVAGLVLTVIALFLAPLAQSRTGRIATLLMLMMILLIAEYSIGFFVINLITYGNSLSASWVFFLSASTILLSLSVSHLLLTATAAQLTPESENRSTQLRISMMVLSMLLVGIAWYSANALEGSVGVFLITSLALAVLWTVFGSMLAAESPVMTPRIRRELPQSFFARVMLTWLTPGPATGLVFATVNIVVLTATMLFGLVLYASQMGNVRPLEIQAFIRISMLFVSYLVGALIAVRLVVAVVRINNHPRVEVGMAAMVTVLVMSALVPYSIGLHLNDYRGYSYSRWQIANWVWTLAEAGPNGSVRTFEVGMVLGCVSIAFIVCLLTMPRIVMPRRIATPEQVEAEQAKAAHPLKLAP